LLPLSPQSVVVLSPDDSIVSACASRRVLSADLASLADARSVRRASISPPQLKIAMAAGFVDIGCQLGDAVVELDEFRASATL
jgi:hypothetical protein